MERTVPDHVHVFEHDQVVVFEDDDGNVAWTPYGLHVDVRTLRAPVDPTTPCPGWPDCPLGRYEMEKK